MRKTSSPQRQLREHAQLPLFFFTFSSLWSLPLLSDLQNRTSRRQIKEETKRRRGRSRLRVPTATAASLRSEGRSRGRFLFHVSCRKFWSSLDTTVRF